MKVISMCFLPLFQHILFCCTNPSYGDDDDDGDDTMPMYMMSWSDVNDRHYDGALGCHQASNKWERRSSASGDLGSLSHDWMPRTDNVMVEDSIIEVFCQNLLEEYYNQNKNVLSLSF